MSVGWEGRRGGSTVARHEWKGLLKMSGKLEDYAEKQRAERANRRAARGQVPGAFELEDSDEE
jgi:DDB1- and CUL4-associated factor 11